MKTLGPTLLAWWMLIPLSAEPLADRFVWIFGWGLGRDSDVVEIARVVQTAGKHGFNGAVISSGMDTLCKQPPDYFRRLSELRKVCGENGLELIPAVFSVGYGGGILSHDRNLAEGLPVENAPLIVSNGVAGLASGGSPRVVNGGFEDYEGNKAKAFDFCDQPGEVSFIDTEVKHGGAASLRLENFNANPHGHGRVMQTVRVEPRRCYRVTVWVKTEDLAPVSAFRLTALADDRELAPRQFRLDPTGDWRRLSMLVNSLGHDRIRLYAGLWQGRGGKLWLDDWSIEETGPVNVLRRPGTPVSIRNEEGSVEYTEGRDYARLEDPQFNPWRDDREAVPLKILPEGRIRDGARLRASWYHSMLIHDSQVTVCMAEPAIYEVFDHEARLLAERVGPKRVLLNMDEVRMGGTCRACRGQDMAELLGRCVSRQAESIRRHIPQAQVYVWSDMFDPNHNARKDYYLVQGDFTGSWKHLPRDLLITVWGGEPREKSLAFFAGERFQMLAACYYDADDLGEVKEWIRLARQVGNVRGFMYTPWQKKYSLVPEFGKLLRDW